MLGVGGMFQAAVTHWQLAAWTAGVMVLGGLVLLAAVLFAPSDDPVSRLRGLIRAWRDPVSTPAPAAADATDRALPESEAWRAIS